MALLAACEIVGGEPLAWLHDVPVAARVRWGKGTVTAIGFGGLFNDANMGFHWLPDPEPAVRDRYEVLYGLLRRVTAHAGRRATEALTGRCTVQRPHLHSYCTGVPMNYEKH